MRTKEQVQKMLNRVESNMSGEEDSEDPTEVIRETLLWVMGVRDDEAVTDFIPE